MSDEEDYKDYQDYLEYQKHLAGSKAPTVPQSTTPKMHTHDGKEVDIPTYESITANDKANGGALDKIVNGIQAGGVGEIAAPLAQLPGMIAKAGKGLANFFKPAVARTAAMGLVKNEAGLGPAVADKVGQATEQFNQRVISPKMTEQFARADGQSVPFNPADYAGIHPKIDELVSKMAQGGVKEIPMKDALELRAAVNDQSMFKDMGPYSEDIAARSQKALGAGNNLRNSINTVDPNIGNISQELKGDYSLRNAVTKPAVKRPISSVEAPIGSDKASLLSQFDDKAGTDLRQFGQDISTAKSRLGGSPGGTVPMSKVAVLHKAAGIAPRAYDSLATLLQPAAESTGKMMQTPQAQSAGQILLQKLLQSKSQGE